MKQTSWNMGQLSGPSYLYVHGSDHQNDEDNVNVSIKVLVLRIRMQVILLIFSHVSYMVKVVLRCKKCMNKNGVNTNYWIKKKCHRHQLVAYRTTKIAATQSIDATQYTYFSSWPDDSPTDNLPKMVLQRLG